MASISVGQLIKPGARGLGLGVPVFLREVVRWQKPLDGGERHPSSASILRYEHNLETRCGFRFAELVAEFLAARASTEIRDGSSVSQALHRCDGVLRAEVERRFLSFAGSDPALHAAEAAYIGAYAVCRKETADKKYHQELLVLERFGDKEPRKPFATYVAPSGVSRGSWCLVGNSLCVTMSGYRGKNRSHDVVSLWIAIEDRGDDMILGGLLAGVSTAGKAPVVMPIIVAKLRTHVRPAIMSIGHGSDAAALALFSAGFGTAGNIMSSHCDLLDQVERTTLPSKIVAAGDLTAPLREKGVSSQQLILDELSQLCAQPRGGATNGTSKKRNR